MSYLKLNGRSLAKTLENGGGRGASAPTSVLREAFVRVHATISCVVDRQMSKLTLP